MCMVLVYCGTSYYTLGPSICAFIHFVFHAHVCVVGGGKHSGFTVRQHLVRQASPQGNDAYCGHEPWWLSALGGLHMRTNGLHICTHTYIHTERHINPCVWKARMDTSSEQHIKIHPVSTRYSSLSRYVYNSNLWCRPLTVNKYTHTQTSTKKWNARKTDSKFPLFK